MDVDPPPPYPAFMDEVTGAEAKADRLRKEKAELEAELAKEKERRKEAEDNVVHNRRKDGRSDGDDRTDSDVVSLGDSSSSSNTDDNRTDTTSDGQTKVLNVEATAYIAMCDSGCTGITATGVDVRDSIYKDGRRVIAVNPSQIPLGSKVRVKAGGQTFEAVAEDTGSDITSGRIDILVNSKEEALNFGRRSVKVEVLD